MYPNLAPIDHTARDHLDKGWNGGNCLIASEAYSEKEEDREIVYLVSISDHWCEENTRDSEMDLMTFSIITNQAEDEKTQPLHLKICIQNSIAVQKTGTPISLATDWVNDSSCNSHVTHGRTAFVTYNTLSSNSIIYPEADSTAPIESSGDVTLTIRRNKNTFEGPLKGVLHVPTLWYQLISVSALANRVIYCSFNHDGVLLTKQKIGASVATGTLEKGVYT